MLFETTTTTEGYPFRFGHKQDWDRVYSFTTTGCCTGLPRSDADRDGVEPALGFFSKTFRPHSPCNARCVRHVIRTWSAVFQWRGTCNSVKERDPICPGRMEFPNMQAIELDPRS